MRPRPSCECRHIDSAHKGYDGPCYICRCPGFILLVKSEVKEQRERFYAEQLAKYERELDAEPMDYDSRVILLRKFGKAMKEAMELSFQIEYDMIYPARLLEIICNPYEYATNIIRAGKALREFLGLDETKRGTADNKDRELIEAYEKRRAKLALVKSNE